MSRRQTFRDPEGLYYIAMVMMWNGDAVRALGVLAQAVTRGFACPAALNADPVWRLVRRRSRFTSLREAVERRHRELALPSGAA